MPLSSTKVSPALPAKGQAVKENEITSELLKGGANAIGAVRFPSSSKDPAMWAKVPDSLSEAQLEDLLTETWKRSKPSVVISITGGAGEFKSLKSKDKLVIERGLAEAVKATGAWLVTGGTDAGVMHLVGRMLANNTSVRDDVVCIGVAPFGLIACSEEMEAAATGTVFKYPGLAEAPSDPAKSKFRLEPNHSHFLLVDPGPENSPSEAEVWLRSKLQNLLCPVEAAPDECAPHKTRMGDGIGGGGMGWNGMGWGWGWDGIGWAVARWGEMRLVA